MERPALRRLPADIDAGRSVVVYKVIGLPVSPGRQGKGMPEEPTGTRTTPLPAPP